MHPGSEAEKVSGGKYRVWYGNGYKTSGPLGEDPRQLTEEEDKTRISEVLESRGFQDFRVVKG